MGGATITGSRDGPRSQPLMLVGWRQAAGAGRMLAQAFHDDPAVRFLFPDERRRQRQLTRVWTGACRYTIRYGEAWYAPELAGAACWLPPGRPYKNLGGMLAAGMGSLFFHLRPRELIANLRNDLYTDALHARLAPGPHWYLFVIGVEPGCQGRGVGSALLRPMLARADREGLPVYLETHRAANVGFYRRFGFEVAGQGRIPGSDVTVYPMLRPPGG